MFGVSELEAPDTTFWLRLEFELSGWLSCSPDRNHRRFWIDGFLPDAITNTRYGADVEGVVWMAEGSRSQRQFHFVVSIPQTILYRPNAARVFEAVFVDETAKTLHVKIGRAQTGTEPAAAPNGGPAASLDNSGAVEGPPSVS
jgi:hypothetical protein